MNMLEFFDHLRNVRLPGDDDDKCRCAGPLIELSLWSWQVYQLERIFEGSQQYSDLLWSGFVTDRYVGICYQLCVAHWFDLVCKIGQLAYRFQRRDWAMQSGSLLSDLCYVVGWDLKEVANLISSLGARLT
jgi:hypothetical protein